MATRAAQERGSERRDGAGGRPERRPRDEPTVHAPFAREIGRTRFVVLVAVVPVIAVSLALFLLGAGQAVKTLWSAGQGALQGNFGSADLTVEILEIVSTMLKAVVFYIIGVGLYSLFIAPLNLTAALGVETFNDLEIKVVSVVVVILGVTFLEHFIAWQQAFETMMFGVALAVVVAALVLFQWHSNRAKEEQKMNDPDAQAKAQRELFHRDREEREVDPDEVAGSRPDTGSA
jgi:uncharacterized membrane protein YqhA